jgi:arylsulfatase A-like enzyme
MLLKRVYQMAKKRLSRRSFLQLTAAATSFLMMPSWSSAAPKHQPNVVFILVDDLSWSDVGCFGSKVYETPYVDQLAKEGMLFSDFYSAGPVCSPTRASILTGKYPARTGVTTYLLSPQRDAKYVTSQLELDEFTLAEALKENKYTSGYFGKWHLGYEMKHSGFRCGRGWYGS